MSGRGYRKKGVLGRISGRRLITIWVILYLLFALFPTIYLTLVSFNPAKMPFSFDPTNISLKWYYELGRHPRLHAAIYRTIIAGLLTVCSATPLSLAAASAYRRTRFKDVYMTSAFLPLVVPGTIIGLSLAILFKLFHVPSSIFTLWIGHTLWAFPFCFIVILVGMTAIRPSHVEASRDLGADAFRAFRDVEWSVIKGSVSGAAIFAFLLSFHEYPITYFVIGEIETLPTYMWGVILTGASGYVYALAGITSILTFIILIMIFIVMPTIRRE